MKKRVIIVATAMAVILVLGMACGYAPAYQVAALMGLFCIVGYVTYALDRKWKAPTKLPLNGRLLSPKNGMTEKRLTA